MPSGCERLCLAVRRTVAERISQSARAAGISADLGSLRPGKMLRVRLAGRLAAGAAPVSVDSPLLRNACAATELFHAASLCHDDVIDHASVRRGRGAFWTVTSASGAVLFGDLLLCEALELLRQTDAGRALGPFMAKIQEVLRAETEQELVQRGRAVDTQTCLRLSRGKTGALFAFVAGACAGEDGPLRERLEEVGYCVGTAYQLADDLLDIDGSEKTAGKTLGTDSARGKITLPRVGEQGRKRTKQEIGKLCAGALRHLSGRPGLRDALRQFIVLDLQPVLERHQSVCVELAV
ncbi:MAG TPA: polyprenyl synthetase family protein [Phycisphaerae bacterium]|nr:polyprenyl synthetase family protein [Phycisphaerae bacterium]